LQQALIATGPVPVERRLKTKTNGPRKKSSSDPPPAARGGWRRVGGTVKMGRALVIKQVPTGAGPAVSIRCFRATGAV